MKKQSLSRHTVPRRLIAHVDIDPAQAYMRHVLQTKPMDPAML